MRATSEITPESIYGSVNDTIIHSREQVLGNTTIKGLECIVKSCGSNPNEVCEGCQQYVCVEHKYRHPDCDDGK